VIVIDASVAVKLYRIEQGSDAALALFNEHAGSISVPDLFAIEVAGAIVRDANISKCDHQDKLANLTALLGSAAVTLVRTANADLLRATNLAIDLGHPLKDCIYLALAMELGCDLVTADARFAAKAREVWAGVRVLETAGLAAGD
jgi:predicted nucleic acid-binding protein